MKSNFCQLRSVILTKFSVRLHISLVEDFENKPHGKEGQLTQWVEISKLHELAFSAANQAIVKKLQSAN